MASDLSFNQQLVFPGIRIPITANRLNGSTEPSVLVDVSISDNKVNLFGTTMKTVRLEYNGTSTKFEGLLSLEYGDIVGADYDTTFLIQGHIRGSSSSTFVTNIYPVHYMSLLNDVKIDSFIPGNESITLLCSHDGSVENPHNMLLDVSNAYIRLFYLDANKAPVFEHLVSTLVEDTATYNDGRMHYKVVVPELNNEIVHELAITMVNKVGPTAALTSVNATPSQYPAAMTFNSFNSLDASGGRFTVSLDNQTGTVATFKTLKMNVSYTSDQVTVPTTVQTIDLSGSYPAASGPPTSVEFLMPPAIKTALFQGSAFNKFTVRASLTADIQDASGKVIKTLTGEQRSADYFMDRPLTVSSFILDAIEWSDGKHTLKASILGGTNDVSYNSVTATFDMCGTSISANPIIDLCNNVTSATVAITIDELKAAKLSVKPRVKMSRKELNNAAITNASPFLELSHVLAALKQGTQPTVEFIPLPTETTKTATFKFTTPTGAVDDLSANTFYRVQLDELGATTKSTVENKILKSVAQMGPSGETFTLFSSTITAGIKCVLRAFTILDLSKYASRYTELNKSQQYLTSLEKNQGAVFKGLPDASISLRPSSNTVDVLDTIRVSGNLKANDLENIYVFGQDVCGQVLFKQEPITSTTRDICGRIMSDNATPDDSEDFAGVFAYDIAFNVGTKPFSHSSVYLTAILDTPEDVDKVVIRTTTSAIETDFVVKVADKNAASAAYTLANDLSNVPTNDAQYALFDASFTAWNAKIITASGEVDAEYSAVSTLPAQLDGSGNGSKWLYEDKKADRDDLAHDIEKIYEHNATQLASYPAISDATAYNTVIITNWRDVSSTHVNGYVTVVKAFMDPSNNSIDPLNPMTWGKSADYPQYHNNLTDPQQTMLSNYSARKALAKARADANLALDTKYADLAVLDVAVANALHTYTNVVNRLANFEATVKVLEDKLAALKTQQLGFATSRDNRKAALVAAAASAKLAEDNAIKALATARSKFFDASGNKLE